MTDFREELIEIIKEVCRPATPNLDDDDRPLAISGLDSLDLSGVLMALEDKYAIKIANEDIEGLSTINAIVAYLETKTG